jgi:hypothetical protein
LGRLAAVSGVICFYCFIGIFNEPPHGLTLGHYGSFILSLLGLST